MPVQMPVLSGGAWFGTASGSGTPDSPFVLSVSGLVPANARRFEDGTVRYLEDGTTIRVLES